MTNRPSLNFWRVLPFVLSVALWGLIFVGLSFVGGCSDEERPEPVDPTTADVSSSSSSGGDDESTSTGDLEESSSSSGGEESSSSGEPDECLDVEEQSEPYGLCGSYCDGTCSDGRRCVNDSIDSLPPFDRSTCSRECTDAAQCDVVDGMAAPICQVGQCFVPCDVEECPDGFECFQPDFVDATPVCLAVRS
jgi:hypothetical protein